MEWPVTDVNLISHLLSSLTLKEAQRLKCLK